MKKCKKCMRKKEKEKEERGSHRYASMPLIGTADIASGPSLTYERAFARYLGAPDPEKRQGSKGPAPNPYNAVVQNLEAQIAQARSNIEHIHGENLHPEIAAMVTGSYEQEIAAAERDIEVARHKLDFFAKGKPTIQQQYEDFLQMYAQLGIQPPEAVQGVGNPHQANRQTLIEAMTAARGFEVPAEMLGSEEAMTNLRDEVADIAGTSAAYPQATTEPNSPTAKDSNRRRIVRTDPAMP